MAFQAIALAGLLVACGGPALPTGSIPTPSAAPQASGAASAAGPAPAPATRAAQTAPGCAAFDSRIWAQTIYDADPERAATLDPDGDALACEELPLGAAPALWTDEAPLDAIPVTLAGITDGDTIDIIVDGRREPVRLIGVDAHEVDGPYQDGECFGPEATAYLDWLLGLGGRLAIEKDREERDRYGRLLRWLWLDLGDGEVFLVNEALIRAGHAERYRNTPNRRYLAELQDAESFAQRHQLGLWNACDTVSDASRAPLVAIASQDSPSGEGCDPAYPDLCLPPPPPDLDCRDVPQARFRVVPPDPHHFDGNSDGVGCEGPG